MTDAAHAGSLDAKRVLLDIRGVTKRFPGVVANDAVTFQVLKGEIHCLLGENGAGKTTLADMLYGVYSPDDGGIYLNGERVEMSSPRDAIRAGIGMVHQHFELVPPMSVIENVVIGTHADSGSTCARPAGASRSCSTPTGWKSTRRPRWGTCPWASSNGSRSSRRCTSESTS